MKLHFQNMGWPSLTFRFSKTDIYSVRPMENFPSVPSITRWSITPGSCLVHICSIFWTVFYPQQKVFLLQAVGGGEDPQQDTVQGKGRGDSSMDDNVNPSEQKKSYPNCGSLPSGLRFLGSVDRIFLNEYKIWKFPRKGFVDPPPPPRL